MGSALYTLSHLILIKYAYEAIIGMLHISEQVLTAVKKSVQVPQLRSGKARFRRHCCLAPKPLSCPCHPVLQERVEK